MKTVTYERSGTPSTAAQAIRIEDGHTLRVLEQAEELRARPLTPAEVHQLAPLLERAAREEAPVQLPTEGGLPDALAVTLLFEDEETPRVRLAPRRLPAHGAGPAYDGLLAALDALLSRELHAARPRAAHLVTPHALLHEQ